VEEGKREKVRRGGSFSSIKSLPIRFFGLVTSRRTCMHKRRAVPRGILLFCRPIHIIKSFFSPALAQHVFLCRYLLYYSASSSTLIMDSSFSSFPIFDHRRLPALLPTLHRNRIDNLFPPKLFLDKANEITLWKCSWLR
jgi:hypothetical protein